MDSVVVFFFFQAEDGIRDLTVTGVQTCALPIWIRPKLPCANSAREKSSTSRVVMSTHRVTRDFNATDVIVSSISDTPHDRGRQHCNLSGCPKATDTESHIAITRRSPRSR